MNKEWLLIIAGCFLSAGCGGGGGGVSGGGATPGYVGSTTKATVTMDNAKALSLDAYVGCQLSSGASVPAKETTGGTGQAALLHEAAAILEQSVTAIVPAQKPTAKTVAATNQETIYGYSGSYTVVINYDQNTGALNGTVTYSHYQETSTSTTLTGLIIFSGSMGASGVYPGSGDAGQIATLNMSMSNLTGTYGSMSYSMTGNLSASIGGATESMTMSVVLTDNGTGRTYWAKDITLTITGNSLTESGTYFDPVHGYVVISTVTPLGASSLDATPTSGQLLFTGANGTKARLTFTGNGYIVEADTIGNGAFVAVP